MRIFKPMFVAVLATVTLVSCGSIKNLEVPTMDTTVTIEPKKGAISEEQFNQWAHADLVTDTIPGMSLDKAYKFLEGKTGTPIVVAVIDSGIDIEHEDLKDEVWTNPKEIAGNKIDDDKNGYVDDIHGWNFLGGNGVAAPEQLEITRIVAKLNPRFKGKTIDDISDDEKVEFEKYQKYLKAYEASSSKHFKTMNRLVQIGENFAAIKKFLGKDNFTIEDLQAIKTEEQKLQAQIDDILGLMLRGLDEKAYLEYYETQKKNKNYDFDFDGRAIVGDNPTDINDTNYGNPYVIGSVEDESHGTHVSGIILATRNNGIGMNGVATNVKLMSVRAVPDGDERDKDVALAIRYAVDNGAKVINMSFGKSFSPYRNWVFDAIKYAEKHDVLLVHAAGNDNKDIDVKDNWPNDSSDKINEFADNVLTVGAISVNYNEKLPATFSNYGQKNVDIFAPGVQIYSTIPQNNYAKYSGTSMASPETAGIAALIRSYYPQLSASQVKHIIMNSGTKLNMKVFKPTSRGQEPELVDFSTLSVTGRIVNAYNALVLADRMVNKR
ncbi:S8 family peptidase [Lutibacter sp.]|uniref:S8 family peptidase n=1 Tax=Lutibacter sp. TaxID=1925666 RepID=UPI0025BCD66A|nr:S8 family peptidase [Lutibacter sp.]MCF6168818.1 S8 family peptidase [Lutibacter sp.]